MSPGRPRSADSQHAILAAAVELLEEGGWSALSIERIAARAGVGKQTIYRWYDGDLGQIVVEAYLGVSDDRVVPPDTGSVVADLQGIVAPVASLNRDRDAGLALANRSLMAHAQVHEAFAVHYRTLHEHWREPMLAAVARGVARGELRSGTNADLVVDLLLGLQWYRLLVGTSSTTEADARTSVEVVLAGYRA